MGDIKQQLGQILTQDIFLAVYRLKFPYPKRRLPSGAVVGKAHFRPEYGQRLYDLIYRDVLIPMSKLPLESLLAVDMSTFLPQPDATDYPEQSLGLVTILDQTRMLTAGYNFRYARAFFDPICEKLCQQLICLPLDVRPDGKNAWLSRGYSLDDWLVRTLWFWAPLVHSDDFMVKDRQTLKDYLHAIRAEVEAQARRADPVAPLENQDDKDINAFKTIETDGPPQRSYADSANMCGHYPYWIRWRGHEWNNEDRDFMEKTSDYRYNPKDEPVLQEIRKDFLAGVWKPMQPNANYENH